VTSFVYRGDLPHRGFCPPPVLTHPRGCHFGCLVAAGRPSPRWPSSSEEGRRVPLRPEAGRSSRSFLLSSGGCFFSFPFFFMATIPLCLSELSEKGDLSARASSPPFQGDSWLPNLFFSLVMRRLLLPFCSPALPLILGVGPPTFFPFRLTTQRGMLFTANWACLPATPPREMIGYVSFYQPAPPPNGCLMRSSFSRASLHHAALFRIGIVFQSCNVLTISGLLLLLSDTTPAVLSLQLLADVWERLLKLLKEIGLRPACAGTLFSSPPLSSFQKSPLFSLTKA